MNMCDLSFFPAIQSLYYKMCGIRNLDGIISAVGRAFDIYDPRKINRGFLSLFMNYNSYLNCEGGTHYKMTHMNKQQLERAGRLPVNIQAEIPGAAATLELVELDDNVEELGDGGDGDWLFNDGVL
jgi:hypothetical protein